MEFLNNLFKKNKSIEEEKSLVHYVEKLDKQESIFINIMNDLEKYIEKSGMKSTNIHKMAYAYARRSAAAGLCIQGIWGEEEYIYTCNIFLNFQQITEHSIEFQEKAADQAVELFQSYDSRFTRKVFARLSAIVNLNPNITKEKGEYIDVNTILKLLNQEN